MEVVGWQEPQRRGIHPSHFVKIAERDIGADKPTTTPVVARVMPFSIDNQANWVGKFEDDTIDNRYSWASALLQSGEYAEENGFLEKFKGRTLITKSSTVQVWSGQAPQSISLELEFKAFTDPILEVEKPIEMLYRMMSADLRDNNLKTVKKVLEKAWEEKSVSALKDIADGLGFVPNPISVSLFKKRFISDYKIESLSESVDKVMVDANGNRVYQVISLSIGSQKAITKEDIYRNKY